MTAEEVWKDIPGYEGLYQAGDLGNIKSLNFNNRGNSELLKQGTDGRGYLVVKLYKNSIPKTIKVGFQKRADTYTQQLGYIIYYDQKNVLRKESSWESWRDKKIEPQEFKNEPTSGFVLNKKEGGLLVATLIEINMENQKDCTITFFMEKIHIQKH